MILVPDSPLEDALHRVQRADDHIRDLDLRISEYLASYHEAALAIFDSKAPDKHLGTPKPLPMIAYILIGEAVYNLRAALDYLVFTLARIDSGRFQDGTQFPIEDRPQTFAKRVHGDQHGR